jgi:leucyl/phenylalanyl-tRNA--protein transferase
MYHVRSDASKAAFAGLVARLVAAGDSTRRLLDAQWLTPHLATLGAVEVPRSEYRVRLAAAVALEPALA